jgi:hypothetical protein
MVLGSPVLVGVVRCNLLVLVRQPLAKQPLGLSMAVVVLVGEKHVGKGVDIHSIQRENCLLQIKLQSILSRLHYVKEIRYRMFYLVKRLMYKVM